MNFDQRQHTLPFSRRIIGNRIHDIMGVWDFFMKEEQTFAKVLLMKSNASVMEHRGFDDRVYRIVEICVRDYRKIF